MTKINCKKCNKELVIFNPQDDNGNLPLRTGNWIAANCTTCNEVTTFYDAMEIKDD